MGCSSTINSATINVVSAIYSEVPYKKSKEGESSREMQSM